jgi:hypothetical protein
MRRCRARWRRRTRPWYGCVPRCWSRTRSWSRCGSWSNCRCRGRSRSPTLNRRLNANRHRRSCFEEVNRGICSLGRLICVEPEIVKCAPANRVGVSIDRKGFRSPGQRIGSLSWRPRRDAVSLTVQCAVVCPTRMLRRSAKFDVTDVNSGS